MAFYNSNRINCLGILPFVSYMPESTYNKRHYCYGVGGASDPNRYSTARAAAKFGDRGIHRFVKGGHTNGPEWAGVEGMVWLNGRFLAEKRRDSGLDNERLDFESSLIHWIGELSEDTSYRAFFWCEFLINDYGIDGANAKLVTTTMKKLEKDPINTRYVQGLAALDDFSDKYFAPVKVGPGAEPAPLGRINKALEKLTETFAGVPEIEMLTLELAKPIGKPK